MSVIEENENKPKRNEILDKLNAPGIKIKVIYFNIILVSVKNLIIFFKKFRQLMIFLMLNLLQTACMSMQKSELNLKIFVFIALENGKKLEIFIKQESETQCIMDHIQQLPKRMLPDQVLNNIFYLFLSYKINYILLNLFYFYKFKKTCCHVLDQKRILIINLIMFCLKIEIIF